MNTSKNNTRSVHFFNEAGEKIAGTLHMPDESTNCGVVLGHCFTCSRHISIIREISTVLAETGMAALRFDFSGNGQSEGDFSHTSYSKHIGEMEHAVRFFAEQGYTRFGLAGHSMGAAVAVLAGARLKDVSGVCALGGRMAGKESAPFFGKEKMEELRRTGRLHFESRGRGLELKENFFTDLQKYDLRETVRNFNPPLLVVHGDQDEIIPVENAREVESLNPDVDVEIVSGANHMFSDPDHRRHIAETVAEWFRNRFEAVPE
ncbi:MAG: alpha/beta hydrolase family protein [Thermodesulfobacteriota bacterium]